MEVEDAVDSVEVYRREKRAGLLKKLESLQSLVENGNFEDSGEVTFIDVGDHSIYK